MALKRVMKGGSDMRIGLNEHEEGSDMAITDYYTLGVVGNLCLLGLEPITGKTHQLRVHCATALDAPILGDTKYGTPVQDDYAHLLGENTPLHLHARQIQFFGAGKQLISVTAPLPPHMAHTFKMMGWNTSEIEKTQLAMV